MRNPFARTKALAHRSEVLACRALLLFSRDYALRKIYVVVNARTLRFRGLRECDVYLGASQMSHILGIDRYPPLGIAYGREQRRWVTRFTNSVAVVEMKAVSDGSRKRVSERLRQFRIDLCAPKPLIR